MTGWLLAHDVSRRLTTFMTCNELPSFVARRTQRQTTQNMKSVKMSAIAQDSRSRDPIFRDALLRFNVIRPTASLWRNAAKVKRPGRDSLPKVCCHPPANSMSLALPLPTVSSVLLRNKVLLEASRQGSPEFRLQQLVEHELQAKVSRRLSRENSKSRQKVNSRFAELADAACGCQPFGSMLAEGLS